MKFPRLVAAAAVLGTALALLTGCAAIETTLPDGVSVAIQQNRDDYGPRRIEITITNDTDATFGILEARLDSGAFAAASATEKPVEVPAGTTKALRLDLDEPACDGVASSPEPKTTVRIAFSADGRSGIATVTPADPLGSIERIHAQDCLAGLVARTVTITPADRLRVVDEGGTPTAELDLTLTPTGSGDPVTVESIGGTILLRPASGLPDWPVGTTFGADDGPTAPVTVTLDVVPNNCNTHTVSEDKRGTFFPVTVTTSGTSGVFYVPVSRDVRGAFYDYIAHDFCHWS